jgi:hypothetical protein
MIPACELNLLQIRELLRLIPQQYHNFASTGTFTKWKKYSMCKLLVCYAKLSQVTHCNASATVVAVVCSLLWTTKHQSVLVLTRVTPAVDNLGIALKFCGKLAR